MHAKAAGRMKKQTRKKGQSWGAWGGPRAKAQSHTSTHTTLYLQPHAVTLPGRTRCWYHLSKSHQPPQCTPVPCCRLPPACSAPHRHCCQLGDSWHLVTSLPVGPPQAGQRNVLHLPLHAQPLPQDSCHCQARAVHHPPAAGRTERSG